MRGRGVGKRRGGWQEHEQSIPPTGNTRSYHLERHCVLSFSFFFFLNHYLKLFGCNFIILATLSFLYYALLLRSEIRVTHLKKGVAVLISIPIN